MNIVRSLPTAALLIVTVAGGIACANRPAKDVREAEAELTSSRQEQRQDVRALEAKHSQERYEAQQRGATASELDELHARQRRELAATQSDNRENVTDAREDKAKAHTEMTRAREEHRASVRERLAKLDGKASEMQAKSGKLSVAQKSEFDRAWRGYVAKHQDVENSIRSLETVPDQEWGTWRDRVKVQLDALEDTVEKLDDEL